MRILLIHQNFPGQFRHVALAWATRPGWQVVALGRDTCPGLPQLNASPQFKLIRYKPHRDGHKDQHPYLRKMEDAVLHGQAVARELMKLKQQGFTPDVILAHPGWGETLYAKDVFPHARLIHLCEWYYNAQGADVNFDPEFPATLDDQLRIRTWNALHLLNLEHCDAAISPTQWQRAQHPAIYQNKIHVAHEGVDTEGLGPNANATFTLPRPLSVRAERVEASACLGASLPPTAVTTTAEPQTLRQAQAERIEETYQPSVPPTVRAEPVEASACLGASLPPTAVTTTAEPQTLRQAQGERIAETHNEREREEHTEPSLTPFTLKAGDPVITYVARNLEPYRGFHQFMRALEIVQREHPTVQTLVVGGDDVSYGKRPSQNAQRNNAQAKTWREHMLQECRVDNTRTHFLGRIPYEQYKKVLQVSSVHVYLTVPFVLSWSLLEAMASGCLVVASNTAPVREVIQDGVNGLLVDFFNPQDIARQILHSLQEPRLGIPLRQAAQAHVQQRYALQTGIQAYEDLLTPKPSSPCSPPSKNHLIGDKTQPLSVRPEPVEGLRATPSAIASPRTLPCATGRRQKVTSMPTTPPRGRTSANPRQTNAVLSPTDWQLLQLLRDGLATEQIAQRRNRSPATVRNQLSVLYEKLGVTSRAQAVAMANGLSHLRGAR